MGHGLLGCTSSWEVPCLELLPAGLAGDGVADSGSVGSSGACCCRPAAPTAAAAGGRSAVASKWLSRLALAEELSVDCCWPGAWPAAAAGEGSSRLPLSDCSPGGTRASCPGEGMWGEATAAVTGAA